MSEADVCPWARGGHALFCLTYAADVHLNEVVAAVAQQLEQAIGRPVIQVIVTDREGLSAEVIRTLALKNKGFVTLLKANQYASEADFVRRGRFRQINDPRTGQTTHRVADADFQLAPDSVHEDCLSRIEWLHLGLDSGDGPVKFLNHASQEMTLAL